METSNLDTSARLPAPALRPFIKSYAGVRVRGLTVDEVVGLPSRHIGLLISFADPIDIVRMPDRAQRPAAYTALVAGLHGAPAIIRQGIEAHGMHVFLTPLGARSVLGVSSGDLASRVVDLCDLWGPEAAGLIDRLASARTWPHRFEILDHAFMARLSPFAPAPEILHAWGELTRAHGSLHIGDLAHEIGWSQRHFTVRFRNVFGIAPKSAARVFRFERACWLIRSRHSLAEVAVASGYCDQAHMSHEWRAFAGCSPRDWIAKQLPFLQDYELAGGDLERPQG